MQVTAGSREVPNRQNRFTSATKLKYAGEHMAPLLLHLRKAAMAGSKRDIAEKGSMRWHAWLGAEQSQGCPGVAVRCHVQALPVVCQLCQLLSHLECMWQAKARYQPPGQDYFTRTLGFRQRNWHGEKRARMHDFAQQLAWIYPPPGGTMCGNKLCQEAEIQSFKSNEIKLRRVLYDIFIGNLPISRWSTDCCYISNRHGNLNTNKWRMHEISEILGAGTFKLYRKLIQSCLLHCC